jgi:hypothetical protein
MCPACIAAALWLTGGVGSVGGLAVLAVRRLQPQLQPKPAAKSEAK